MQQCIPQIGGLLIFQGKTMTSVSSPSKIPYEKKPFLYEEQLSLLEKRGLVLDMPRETILALLEQISYYHLEAYWFQFYDRNKSEHTFLPEVTFSRVWELYRFDRRLRELVFHALERIENSFKNKFAYVTAHEFNTSHPYSQIGSVTNTNRLKVNCDKLAKDLIDSKEQFVTHFKNTYSDDLPPVWMAVELMTFGELAKWCREILVPSLGKKIAKAYGIDSVDVFNSWILHLSYLRNICVHHFRLWNKRLTLTAKCLDGDAAFKKAWMIRQPQSDRKLYHSILVIDYLWQVICPEAKGAWKMEFRALVDAYHIDVRDMGFPNDWMTLMRWREKT